MAEHDEQVAVFTWARFNQGKHPELRLMYAIPNAGKRSPASARWYKAEGLRAGVCDIHLPIARGGYNGLWVEMKYGKNKPTSEQEEFMAGVAVEGHMTAVCYSADEAVNVIKGYLSAED